MIFATAVDPRGAFKQISGLAIGLTITIGVLMAYGLTGGAMNPARAFGPQLVGDHWAHWWVWYIGPFAGGVIAASLYELLYLRQQPVPPVGTPESGVDEPRRPTRPAASSGRFPPRMLSTIALVVAGLSTGEQDRARPRRPRVRRLRAHLVVRAAAALPGLPRQAPRLVRGRLRPLLHRDDQRRALLRPRAVGGVRGRTTATTTTTTATTTSAATTATATTTTAPVTTTARRGRPGRPDCRQGGLRLGRLRRLPHAEGGGLDRNGRPEPRPAEAARSTGSCTQVENGGGPMPAFKGQLTDKQIQDVAAYVYASTHCLETAP